MKLLFENENGYSIEMSQSNRTARLIKWNFGAVSEVTNTYKIPYYHGELYENCRLEARDCDFTVYTYGDNKQDIISALNPLSKVTLTVNGKYKAIGKIINTPKFTQYKRGEFSFTFRMFEPFFKTDTVTYEFNGSGKLINISDVPAPARITLYGPATNPYISDSTLGKTISFEYTLPEGSRIEIDTDMLRNDIKIMSASGSESGFAYKASGSAIFSLAAGLNQFKSNCSVKLEYEPRFLEVIL